MTSAPDDLAGEVVHTVSVVVPVYRGEHHLAGLVKELAPLVEGGATSPDGYPYRVVETILVHDCGPDDSARVLREQAAEHDWVRPVWLSRNYGQHAATIAGIASSAGEWVVTMDEDGQHDPADIGTLLDAAMGAGASLVYAAPVNAAPHSAFRRLTSWSAKRMLNLLGGGIDASLFQSYRLVLGEVGRSVAAYAGHNVYLDVALGWVVGRPVTAPVTLRPEGGEAGVRRSGYSTRTLLSHFWRMVVTSGTRTLRLVSVTGAVLALLGVVLAVVLAVARLQGHNLVQGWTSLMVVTLLCTGAIMVALGVVAEYVGVAVNMAMGKPLYLITTDPGGGPLGRRHSAPPGRR